MITELVADGEAHVSRVKCDVIDDSEIHDDGVHDDNGEV